MKLIKTVLTVALMVTIIITMVSTGYLEKMSTEATEINPYYGLILTWVAVLTFPYLVSDFIVKGLYNLFQRLTNKLH